MELSDRSCPITKISWPRKLAYIYQNCPQRIVCFLRCSFVYRGSITKETAIRLFTKYD